MRIGKPKFKDFYETFLMWNVVQEGASVLYSSHPMIILFDFLIDFEIRTKVSQTREN